MDALALLLIDSRAPAGAHHHSGGMEPAVSAGLVTDIDDLAVFCAGRLATAGTVAAAFAAAGWGAWAEAAPPSLWGALDAELDARTPSAAARRASRLLGGGVRRLLRAVAPAADVDGAWADVPSPAPHHPLALGACVAVGGGDITVAATAAALGSVVGPASAAVRLLGLDPFAVYALLARLGPDVDEVATAGVASARRCAPADLPADGAPGLDLLADAHLLEEVRLFAS